MLRHTINSISRVRIAPASALVQRCSRSFLRCHSTAATSASAASGSSSSGSPPTSASVDPAEVAKFSSMASEWWNINGHVRPLHLMNPCRVRFIIQQCTQHLQRHDRKTSLASPLRGLSVLDIGCGGGLLSESLARLGGQVHGIDAATASIHIAQLHAQKDPLFQTQTPPSAAATSPPSTPTVPRLRYSNVSAESLVSRGEQYDVVCSLEVLEHVNDPKAFVQTCMNLVKPGGLLFLSTINRTTQSYAMTIVAAEHILRWVPVGTHDWSKYLTPHEVNEFISQAQQTNTGAPIPATVRAVSGMLYDPIRDSWLLSEKDTFCNYILVAEREL